ncbi:MAG: MraY family glycosyltransferase [Planctomycetota bacterium]|nr:MraY family glycosyltransferase [Planctomycetota bacterium]MDA1163400.1 MraY family glycosyltransferase [Planctomycetota bacterium]
MVFLIAACFGSALLVSIVSTRIVQELAPRLGLIDQPAARKVHVTPTPLGGGIGIWLGVVLPLAAAHLAVRVIAQQEHHPEWLPEEIRPHLAGFLNQAGRLWGIVAGATILSVMGLIDDIRNLPWQPRLAVQILVACVLAASGVRATVFAPWPWLGFVIAVGWMLVLINSINFLDNMDGLTGGISLIASLMFAVIMLTALGEPRWFVAAVLLILAGSLTGFLWWNWSPASIFMGDTGSYFVGLMLAAMTIVGTFYEESPTIGRHVMLAPLCVLAVPLYDFTSVLLIRLSQGRSPFSPDKSHFSHRLVELGLQPRNAVLTVHLATLTTGIGGLLLYKVSDWSSAAAVLGLIVCVLLIVAILETAGRSKRVETESEDEDRS